MTDAIIINGDALNLVLPDESVDLIVTSPPYFALRNYEDGGDAYDGQVGSEPTPAEYLDAMVTATAEWMRVLKPSGSIFVNLGDKYAGGGGGPSGGIIADARMPARGAGVDRTFGFRPKSLMGLPWRYAIRCTDELGLVLRSEIIWHKLNGLPESVTDRVRRSHEQFFHFTKGPRYYAAIDAIREPHLEPNRKRADVFGGKTATNGVRHAGASGYTGAGKTWEDRKAEGEVRASRSAEAIGTEGAFQGGTLAANPLGRVPGSVWPLAMAPLNVPAELGVDHFAAFPPALVRPIVEGFSPREVCTVCGQGRTPVGEDSEAYRAHRAATGDYNKGNYTPGEGYVGEGGAWRIRDVRHDTHSGGTVVPPRERRIVGWACGCEDASAPSTPGVVLDPFGGSGTTAMVASVLGRRGLSNDMSLDYCRLARWRTTDPGERARVLGDPKPKVLPAAQGTVFDLLLDEVSA